MHYKNAFCQLSRLVKKSFFQFIRMLHKSRGIILTSTDYGEASLVVKIYTALFGIQSYLINSVRKRNARIHSNIFQPLTPVDLVVYHKNRPGLQRISEIRPFVRLSEA